MSKNYLNYVGEIITDVEYHGLGEPKDFLEVHMDVELPFRLYCRTDEKDWEEVTEAQRLELISQLEDTKSKYSKSDYRYYTMDFYLASLGGL
ncbi:hypothetical protein JZO66_04845 [Enterococcus sp. DIV0242_7C1]|uniref:Uncharacterized protein n=1 Tax=Candidatus Enterococcus dunnyi TaxID=1834192 RepID=A0A200J7U3_9ENTE|nr:MULTISPECIES: hypothetical protein [unclassified Enterococcus]MBO0469861.1 hypothetical protein [Enterococcus sp. DIV0242_7C1]MCA5012128.1 hypothetical protein [Enterococcus sp. S23]MCA5015379.1 hypothetical protein [Enterococcus sp. S22(2020)]OUZ32901.1 hypothetical protein A5889_001610 [Enterococcus sp. 9D6_DIV0238]